MDLLSFALPLSFHSTSSRAVHESAWKWRAQLQTNKRPTFVQKENEKSLIAAAPLPAPASCCCCCGRRHSLGALLAALAVNVVPERAQASSDNHKVRIRDFTCLAYPARPRWYEELYAALMEAGMKSYEMQMESNKAQLFSSIDTKARDVLELGIGTGPNLKYYANRPDIRVVGVDPNQSMEKYARVAASKAGLQDSQFKFVQAVGEALPIGVSSMDVVICTLVLCSVVDVAATLTEVRRVLRPGGSFLFIEHVAAPVGSRLRFWQDLLDPLQQFVADGCHLTRNTGDYIKDGSFTTVTIKNIDVPSISLFSPHIIGVAHA